MIKAILTDFYGVVYDNFNWPVIYERVHSDPAKSAQLLQLIDQINKGLIDNLTFKEAVGRLADDAQHPDRPAVYPNPAINRGLIDYLQTLRPSLKVGLLSNGNRDDVERVLKREGVEDAFDLVVVSSELGLYKPHPNVFDAALKQLDPTLKASEVIMIDDSPRHVAGAQAAGLHALKYTDLPSLKTAIEGLLQNA